MGLIIPKCNAEPETLKYTLQIYYDASDWVSNAELIDRLSSILIANGIEEEKKEPQSYTKKTQVLSYYGLLEWENPLSNQSRRRITDYGKRLYVSLQEEDEVARLNLLVEILEKNTFGRNVLGCDSDSDLEAPNIFVKSSLLLGHLTNKEFAYILGRMENDKVDFADTLFEVLIKRRQGIPVEPDSRSAKWADPKPLLALADWGFFTITRDGVSKQYVLNRDLIELWGVRISQLKIKNTEERRIDADIFVDDYDDDSPSLPPIDPSQCTKYIDIITAAKTKPFILLAGISGTGKSRIVRELARACWDEGTEGYKAQKPQNFEMIQVKPNWHDSTELLGYVSRVSGKPVYVVGDFLRFITKAWENIDVPHFLCLDEMNLAPVEQYFAEYLSVVESRKLREGRVVTDAILKKCIDHWFFDLTAQLTEDEDLRKQFNNEGIALPPNLIVVGTVNMDETTFSFSRKVLDRAMTIEMNEVDLWGGLDSKYERIGKLSGDMLIGKAVEGVDVYADNKEACDIALEYLKSVNEILDKTPFKVAYRTRNEFLLYVVNNLPYTIGEDGTEYSRKNVIATALDEITSMKVLSRIEGDDTKVPKTLLKGLKHCIETQLLQITGEDDRIESVSIAKLDEMLQRLESGYTSFWS